MTSWIDPFAGVGHWSAVAEKASGVLIAAHPQDPTLGWRLDPPGPTALLEVWNGAADRRVRPELAEGVAAVWRLGGRGFVGGSDIHVPGNGRAPGTPTTWVQVDAAVSGGGPCPPTRRGALVGDVATAALDGLRRGARPSRSVRAGR